MIPPKLETLTVVYTINDPAEFEAENKHVFDNFQSSDGLPWAITAVSRGHEIHRLALIEEAIERKEYDLAEQIIGLTDPHKYRDLDELIASDVGVLFA